MINTDYHNAIKVLLRIPERSFTRYCTMNVACISGDKNVDLPIFPATREGSLQLSSEFQDDRFSCYLSLKLTQISLNTHVITRF
jgi:hypothetical protein